MNTLNAVAPPLYPHGKDLPNTQVVAADLIALVAGVNLASVNKVIVAINLIAATIHEDYADILDPESLPTERAVGDRLVDTEAVARVIASKPEALEVEGLLHFVERMSRH